MRSARVMGFWRMRSMKVCLPTMIPAWGPPRSLSPLKVTTSAPLATDACTVGSFSRP